MQREKENQIQRECKAQMQAERESQLLLEREAQFRKHEAQMQRERDLQMQREKEAQVLREKEAQIQREKEAQLQREKEAQLQREREAQLKREHEAKIQRERETQIRREKETQLLKEKEELIKQEREENLKREKEAKLKREKEVQLQLLQRERNAQLEMERKAQIRRDMFMQHENQFFQVNQPGHINMHHMGNLMHHHLNFQNQHDVNSLIKKSSMPSTTMSSHPFYSSQLKNTAVSSGMPSLSKPMALGSSLIHFPQSSSPANQIQDEQWVLSQNMTNILKKSSNSLDDNFLSTLDPNYRDRNVFETQYQGNQLIKNLDDIDLTIDRHISPIKIEDKESEKTNTFPLYQGFQSQSSSGITQMHENLKVTTASGSHEAVPHITFSKFSQQSTPWDQQQQQKGDSSNVSNPPSIAFSHSNSVKVTQSSSVNINININMPSHHGFPFQLPELTTSVDDASKVNSTNEKKKQNNAEVDISKHVAVTQQHVSAVSLNQQISVPQQHNVIATQEIIPGLSIHPHASVPQEHVTAVSLAQHVSVSQHHMSAVSLETKDFPNVTKSSEYKINNEMSRAPFTTETTTVLETSDCAISKIESPLNQSFSEDMSPIIDNDISTTVTQVESKQKQSFSSIECFLGMNTNTVDSELKFMSPVASSSSLEIARSVLEQQDRISVIKPLNEEKLESTEVIEEKMETNEVEMKISEDKIKRNEGGLNLGDEEMIGNFKEIEHVHDGTGNELQTVVEEKGNHGNHGVPGNYSRFKNDQVKGSADWPDDMQEIISNTDQFGNIVEGDSEDNFGNLHSKVHGSNTSDQFDNLHKKVSDTSKFGNIQQHDEHTNQFGNTHLEVTNKNQFSSLHGKVGKAEQSRNLPKKGASTQFANPHGKVAKVEQTEHLKKHQKGDSIQQFGNICGKVDSTVHLGNLHEKGNSTGEMLENVHDKPINVKPAENLKKKKVHTELSANLHGKIVSTNTSENIKEKRSFSDSHNTKGWSENLQKKGDCTENFEIQYEKGGNHDQTETKLISSVVAPVHPSMRFLGSNLSTSQSSKVDVENADGRLMHPSMRLRRNSLKSPTSGPEDDTFIKSDTPVSEKMEPVQHSNQLQQQQQQQVQKQQENPLFQQHKQNMQGKYPEHSQQQQKLMKHSQKQYHHEQKQQEDQPEIHYHVKKQQKQKHQQPQQQTYEHYKQKQQQQQPPPKWQQQQHQQQHNEEQRQQAHKLPPQQSALNKQTNQQQQKVNQIEEKVFPLHQPQPQKQHQIEKHHQEKHHKLQQQLQHHPQSRHQPQQQQTEPPQCQKQKQKQQQQRELKHHQQKQQLQKQQHQHLEQQQEQHQQKHKQQQQQKQTHEQSSNEISGASVSHKLSDLTIKQKPFRPVNPVLAEKPANISISINKPVTPEKPMNILSSKPINHTPHGGKPASYNASLSEHAKSAPSGKPLSYLQSIADANKAEALAKLPSSGNTGRKKRDVSTAKTVTRKSRVRPTKSLNETEQKVENDEEEPLVSSPVQKNVKNKPMSVQYNHDRVKESNNQAVLPTEKVPSSSNKQNSRSVLTNEKAFTFNKITFDGKEAKESSGSDTDSSSESEDEEKQGKIFVCVLSFLPSHLHFHTCMYIHMHRYVYVDVVVVIVVLSVFIILNIRHR